MSSKSRVGITGASGVLGRSLVPTWTDVEFVPFQGDIREAEPVTSWYRAAGPLDAVLHLAALVPVHQVNADPVAAFRVNVAGTLHVLEAIRTGSSPAPWTFIASSSHVYQSSLTPLAEDSPLEPITIYGRTKLQAEEWGAVYRTTFGLPVCVGRIFSYSSPRQASSYFVPSVAERIRTAPVGAALEFRGLEGTRDFLTTDQVTLAIQRLRDSRSTGVFNIATGHGVRLGDLVDGVRRRLGREDVTIASTGTDTHHLVANTDKLKRLGLDLRFDLDAFIATTIA